MQKSIPRATVQVLARSIYKEASKYGFGQLDMIRLVNELMDLCTAPEDGLPAATDSGAMALPEADESMALPVSSDHLKIRSFEEDRDRSMLESWLSDKYGRYFVLSSTAARSVTVDELIDGERNLLGVVTTLEDKPIGALAYLDHDNEQRRAELRKLIGDPDYRGMGLAEEATRLWLAYGIRELGLEKIYVSTLQTHISNINLNERIGFQVEGLLRDEVLIDGQRHDVLRMGYCAT